MTIRGDDWPAHPEAMNAALTSFFIVGIGGALGAMSRFGLTLVAANKPGGLPFGTLFANLLGCFLMGVLIQILARSNEMAAESLLIDHHRLLFGIGFCGAFTTLSALVFEASQMLQRNDLGLAFGYLTGTLLGGFACFYAGAVLVRWLAQAHSG